jgi:two-component system, LuxR family, sensor histidine kinase TtrS
MFRVEKTSEGKMKKLIVPVILMALCLLWTTAAFAGEYKIGVLAKRGAPKAMQKWAATGEYLTKALGEKVTIVPLKFTAVEPAVKSGQVDFVLANSSFYVELEKKFGVRAIATLINSRGGAALQEFGGVLFTKSDSPVKDVADVKGKKFMCVKYSSFGGAHMAWRLLLENGIDPKTDCASFLEGGKHDNVVLAVLNGTADVGTVRSDTIERMHDEGKIDKSQLRLINPISDDFPFVHSTQLYPEWPLAATDKVSDELAQKVAKALIDMPTSAAAATKAKIVGWSTPADYSDVRACLQAIGYGAFKG